MKQRTIPDKVYAILFVTDYDTAKMDYRDFVDTICNNLLAKEKHNNDGNWVKFDSLPPLSVSIVEIAQSREEALVKLSESHYDVVIVGNKVNNKVIGNASLNKMRACSPRTMFINFLKSSQKAGAILSDGSISRGEGVTKMHESGFYNGFYLKNVNIIDLFLLIKQGGRTAEEALDYYGLSQDKDETLGKGSDERIESLKEIGEYKEETKNQEIEAHESFVEKKEVTDSVESSEKVLVENVKEKGIDNFTDNSVQGEPETELTQESPAKLSKSAKRRLKEQERKESLEAEVQRLREELALAKKEKVSMPEPDISTYESHNEVLVDPSQLERGDIFTELRNMMNQRGQINCELAETGMLSGKVLFAEDDVVMIKLEKTLQEQGVGIFDVYKAPVMIPYMKYR